MSSIAASLAEEYPASNTDFGVRLQPLIDAVAGGARPTLRLLMSAVAVLLLIACANVANLLLAKGLRRERETSVMAALGASRARIVRLFLIEGLALGAFGAAGGLLLAAWECGCCMTSRVLPCHAHPTSPSTRTCSGSPRRSASARRPCSPWRRRCSCRASS